MAPLKTRKEQLELVTRIRDEFSTDGVIEWKRAFAAHPEYKTQLGVNGNLGKVYTLAHELKKAKGQVAAVPVPTTEKTWGDPARTELIQTIFKENASRGGMVPWKKVFAKNQHIAKDLGVLNEKGHFDKQAFGRLNWYVGEMKRRGLLPRKGSKSSARAPRAARADVVSQELESAPAKVAANNCPNCGFHMALVNETFNAIYKLQAGDR